MINIQLKSNRQNLLLDPIIGSCLLSLFRNGITEQDIVELVQLFQNSLQENKLHIKDTSQGEKTVTDSYEFLQGNGGWKALVNELKKYDGIKEAVRHETMILKKLKAENSMIMRESKNLSELCQTTYHLISILDNYCSYFKGYFDQCQNKNTFNITLNNVLLPLIILANHHYSDNSQNKKENGSQDQNDMSEYNNKENDVQCLYFRLNQQCIASKQEIYKLYKWQVNLQGLKILEIMLGNWQTYYKKFDFEKGIDEV